MGEVPGTRDAAWEVVERTGLDAALGIEDIPGRLERMVTGKGLTDAAALSARKEAWAHFPRDISKD